MASDLKFGGGPLWRRRPAFVYSANEEEEEDIYIIKLGDSGIITNRNRDSMLDMGDGSRMRGIVYIYNIIQNR